jgi:N-acetylmuramoyl-L-alanine amidase
MDHVEKAMVRQDLDVRCVGVATRGCERAGCLELGRIFHAPLRWLYIVCELLCLAGCASLPTGYDRSYVAKSQDSRVQFLILHFTAENLESSLNYLTQGPVSSHYLVTDEPTPRVLQLVDESQRAYHAGQSSWGPNISGLNASSIGIEIVNLGSRVADFQDYPKAQIDVVLALCQDIVRRHSIAPHRVLGHSDIAPQRKDDPGPKFPWKRFADAGLILWPGEAQVAQRRPNFEASVPDVSWFQQKLAVFGYAVPQSGALDEPTRRVIAAFQMRYRPSRYDGVPDAETAAMIDVLVSMLN